MASRYSQTVDLENWNSSHALAVMSVPPGSRVLDLGTADGSVARALKDRCCTVWGIECDGQAADAASQVCDRVIVADLEASEAFDALDGETFDVVLALDVLEHLRDPAPVLRRAAKHLTPKGIAVVSIPNVTHGALRVSLLKGRFNYTEQGLLDRTHLRFFDRDSAERLMGEAGLTIEQNLRVRRELDETEIAVSVDGLSPELLDTLARDPDATTYQFVFVAGLKDGLPASPPGGMLAERLIVENDSLLKQYRELEAYVRSLEADRTARIEDAARELKAHQDEIAQAQSTYANATSEKEALRAQFRELLAEREQLLTGRHRLEEALQELERRVQEAHRLQADFRQTKADVILKDAYISELRQQVNLLVAQRGNLETTVRELHAYTNSAGFQIVESVIRRLKSFPIVYRATRAMARRIARRGTTVD